MPRSMMSAPVGPGGGLDPVHLLEDVRRQALDAVKVRHGLVLGAESHGLRGIGLLRDGRLGIQASARRLLRLLAGGRPASGGGFCRVSASRGAGGLVAGLRSGIELRLGGLLTSSADVAAASARCRRRTCRWACTPGIPGRELGDEIRATSPTVGPQPARRRDIPDGIEVAGAGRQRRDADQGAASATAATRGGLRKGHTHVWYLRSAHCSGISRAVER